MKKIELAPIGCIGLIIIIIILTLCSCSPVKNMGAWVKQSDYKLGTRIVNEFRNLSNTKGKRFISDSSLCADSDTVRIYRTKKGYIFEK